MGNCFVRQFYLYSINAYLSMYTLVALIEGFLNCYHIWVGDF